METVRRSDLWARAAAAPHALSEVPFTYRDIDGRLPAPDPADPVEAPRLLEGVVDLVFREEDGWVLVDYKTDGGTDPGFPARERVYRRQVELYAAAWEALTGEAIRERVLFYTARPERSLTW